MCELMWGFEIIISFFILSKMVAVVGGPNSLDLPKGYWSRMHRLVDYFPKTLSSL